LCLWKNSTSEFNIDLLKVIGMLIRYLDTRVLTGLHVQLATQTVTVDDQNLDAVSSFVSIGWSEEQLIQAQKDDPDVKFLLDLLEGCRISEFEQNTTVLHRKVDALCYTRKQVETVFGSNACFLVSAESW